MLERLVVAPLAEVPEHPQEDVLDQVVQVGRPAREAPEDPRDVRLVAAQEEVEGMVVAGLGAPDESLIARFARRRRHGQWLTVVWTVPVLPCGPVTLVSTTAPVEVVVPLELTLIVWPLAVVIVPPLERPVEVGAVEPL